jgi:SAM-dependent methyltransferase
MLASAGVETTGLDPTAALLQRARELHPEGEYVEGRGENLGMFADGAFDLVVAYLSLIDIAAADLAIAEMSHVLAPGGELLVANLNGFATAGEPEPWRMTTPLGERRATFDRYFEIRPQPARWRGIDVTNWHRPLSWYFGEFLANGLTLVEFLEPAPGPDSRPADKAARYRRAPHFCVFRWKKPAP